MIHRSPDAATSLQRKLRDFASTLTDEERDLFFGILAIAARADEPEVAGFSLKSPRFGVWDTGPDVEIDLVAIEAMTAQRDAAIELASTIVKDVTRRPKTPDHATR
jgi:hypothetical protein